jgi:radical SAM superfamily enzyme YgiQ (UPF0313 family)
MIGLPGEGPEDVKAIVELTKKIRHDLVTRNRGEMDGARITLSVNSFVPKPGTPFQWHPFEEVRRLQEKIKAIRNGLKRERGIEVAAERSLDGVHSPRTGRTHETRIRSSHEAHAMTVRREPSGRFHEPLLAAAPTQRPRRIDQEQSHESDSSCS